MMEMRIAIEGKALELLASTLDENSSTALYNHVRTAREYVADGEPAASVLAEKFFDFHHEICICSGNFILPLLFNTFRYATLTYWEIAVNHLGPQKCVDLMEEMYQVIMKKDAQKSVSYLFNELQMFMTQVR